MYSIKICHFSKTQTNCDVNSIKTIKLASYVECDSDSQSQIYETSSNDVSDIELEDDECEQFGNSDSGENDDSDKVNEAAVEAECASNEVLGKDRVTRWRLQAPDKIGPTAKRDLKICLPQPTGPLKQRKYASPVEVWNALAKDLNNIILEHTNVYLKARRQQADFESVSHHYHDLNLTELNAFLGLLLLTSIQKSAHEDIDHLFASDGTGRDFYRATMSAKRFKVLMECLRFDNKETRASRSKIDKTAAISEYIEQLNRNFQECFSPGDVLCIDETLVGFKGKSKEVWF